MQCMADVQGKQCKKNTSRPDQRCFQHIGAKAIGSPRSRDSRISSIPPVGGAVPAGNEVPSPLASLPRNLSLHPLVLGAKLESRFARTSQEKFYAPHYREAEKAPADYSGSDSVFHALSVAETGLKVGVASGNWGVLGVGIISSGFTAAALYGAARIKYGKLDFSSNELFRNSEIEPPNFFAPTKVLGVPIIWKNKKYDEELKERRDKATEALAERRIKLPSNGVEDVVFEHWRRLENKAEEMRSRVVEHIEDGLPSGTRAAASLYLSYRDQFYAIAAEPDPAAAALERAEEISKYPLSDEVQYVPYAPYRIGEISEEEREAAADIIIELRAFSKNLSAQTEEDKLLNDPLVSDA